LASILIFSEKSAISSLEVEPGEKSKGEPPPTPIFENQTTAPSRSARYGGAKKQTKKTNKQPQGVFEGRSNTWLK
jgi:hypothetical protein